MEQKHMSCKTDPKNLFGTPSLGNQYYWASVLEQLKIGVN